MQTNPIWYPSDMQPWQLAGPLSNSSPQDPIIGQQLARGETSRVPAGRIHQKVTAFSGAETSAAVSDRQPVKRILAATQSLNPVQLFWKFEFEAGFVSVSSGDERIRGAEKT